MSNEKNTDAAENKIVLTDQEIEKGRAMLSAMLSADDEDSMLPLDEAFDRIARDPLTIKMLADEDLAGATDRVKELMERAQLKAIFSVVEQQAEQTQTDNPNIEFVKLLLQTLNDENPDKEASRKLELLLGKMLDIAKKLPDIEGNELVSKTIEALDTVYKYLQKGATEEDLKKFFKKQLDFMAIPRPAGIEDVIKICDSGGNETSLIEFESGNKISFTGRLSIDEQKINEMIRIAFAKNNPYGAKENLNTLIELPFSDTMNILGRKLTARNRTEFSRQLKKEILPNIAHEHLELKIGKDGSFIRMEIGGGYFAVNVRQDKIYFKISDPYASYLIQRNMSQYSSKTLYLGTQRQPLSFYLAVKMQDQYFHDGNRARGTYNKLRINTILNFCSDIIPSYEHVQRTNRGHWKTDIMKVLENALNEIQTAGLFDWQYIRQDNTRVPPKEIREADYQTWKTYYISFELIPEEPDQKARLDRKRDRLEAAQARKAVKDAEKSIKADKPEKERAKRQKK